MSPGQRRGPAATPAPENAATAKQQVHSHDATRRPQQAARHDEGALFEPVVSAHPDHGRRVSWTVPTPDELRERGVEQVERRASGWERAAIDELLVEVIITAKAENISFSANDVRPRLPDGVHGALVGARFLAAAKAGRIVRVGYTRSTDPRTRSAVVAVWRPA